MFKKLLFILFVLSFSILAFALDDQGNPNDPNVNDRANACYEDGSMAGKCDTDWEWEGGWYLIRFQAGLISREDFPAQYAILLPPLPQEEAADIPTGIPTAGCVLTAASNYIDFNGGNFLPSPVQTYTDSGCTSAGSIFGAPFVYTTGNLAAAAAICAAQASLPNAVPLGVNIFWCST
jgi:hypothetical protein